MVLVDTSSWIAYLCEGSVSRQQTALDDLLDRGEVATCPVIMAEILRGAPNDKSYRELSRLFLPLYRLPVNDAVWEIVYSLSYSLARSGLATPLADLLIAGTAIHHQCSLLHQDALFERISQKTTLKIYKA